MPDKGPLSLTAWDLVRESMHFAPATDLCEMPSLLCMDLRTCNCPLAIMQQGLVFTYTQEIHLCTSSSRNSLAGSGTAQPTATILVVLIRRFCRSITQLAYLCVLGPALFPHYPHCPRCPHCSHC